MEFKDHFSNHSADYAKYRPSYPKALFEFLAIISPNNEKAWDCATGNGQAALGLAEFFENVIATDLSQSQLNNATPNNKIIYQLAAAEKTTIETSSIDLVTVAQALHWFNLEAFYTEVRRVLKPNGIIAVWCYRRIEISQEIDPKIEEFYNEIIGPYWPTERKLVDEGYRSIDFPFEEIISPNIHMQKELSLIDLIGYLRTWSATQEFIKSRKIDPTDLIAEDLKLKWGSIENKKIVKWPFNIRIGKFTKTSIR